jgi:hypothetical protein
MLGSSGGTITLAELHALHDWSRFILDGLNDEFMRVDGSEPIKLVCAAATNFHESRYRNAWREVLTPEFMALIDVFCLHVYSTDIGKYKGAYQELSAILNGFPVLLGEVGANHNSSAEARIKRITDIVSLLRNQSLNLIGACPYSWREPDYSERPLWTCRGTEVETFVRQQSGD